MAEQRDAAPEARKSRARPGRRRLRPRTALDGLGWLIPPALGLRLGAYVASGSAWLAGSTARFLVPGLVREYPRRVGDLLGEAFSPDDARRLMRERLAVLVARRLVSHVLASHRGQGHLGKHLEVAGLEHLEAALALGRGVVLVSTHFGLPYLMRPVLRRWGVRQVHARRGRERVHHVSVSGDAWARLAALRRFRAVLEGGGACVLLADGRMGAPIHMPFFRGETTITLGAFYLGHAARSPVLPFFGVMPDHRSRLRVEIAPALASAKGSSGAALGAVAEEFFGVYRAYVRRYPSHLPYRFVRAEPSAP